MSGTSWGYPCIPLDPVYGCIGQHTIAFHKDLLGWIPAGQKYVAAPNSKTTITLERLALPQTGNYLMGQIPIRGSSTHFYSVEARRFVGYDSRLPGEAVIIHNVDTTRSDCLAQVVDIDNNGNPNDTGAMWTPGEVFSDTENQITVSVDSMTDTGFVVTIETSGLGYANISVIKTDTPDPVLVGNNLTYTITVDNNGPDTATGVTLSDTLPSNVTYVSATSTQGTCSKSGSTVTCSIGTLANGASATVTIVVTPTTAGTINNTATVTCNETDTNSSNNTATATTTVNAQPSTDLSVSKADTPDPVMVGNNITYTIVATTNGPSTATGVTLTDTLPSSVTYVSATSTQGSCTRTGSTVTCSIGSLVNGASVTVTIIVTPTTAGTITNTATATCKETDSNTSNNTATATTTVNASPTGCSTWSDVITKYNSYVSGSTSWNDVIACYTKYTSAE
jgi:uncharacterized repeat protein (TIGR01451 family)